MTTVIYWLCIMCSSLSGSFVPDLIVSMTHQMWLHLQSDESVGSIGFKINYKGKNWVCAWKETRGRKVENFDMHVNE